MVRVRQRARERTSALGENASFCGSRVSLEEVGTRCVVQLDRRFELVHALNLRRRVQLLCLQILGVSPGTTVERRTTSSLHRSSPPTRA